MHRNRLIQPFLLGLAIWLALTSGVAVADDAQVWAALKEGGKVVLLRHTHVVIQEGIGRLAPGNCAAEINLSPHGVEQAKRLGEAFRAHGVVVGDVLASPFCRCLDTGKLAFGHATAAPYLLAPGLVSDEKADSNNERVLQEILHHRGPANLVMITHDLNIARIVLEPADMGDFYVLQPHGDDFTVIGRIHQFAQ